MFNFSKCLWKLFNANDARLLSDARFILDLLKSDNFGWGKLRDGDKAGDEGKWHYVSYTIMWIWYANDKLFLLWRLFLHEVLKLNSLFSFTKCIRSYSTWLSKVLRLRIWVCFINNSFAEQYLSILLVVFDVSNTVVSCWRLIQIGMI